ncbi:cupin domain-containing protein [Methanogenium organophilum]|uniref:Cupin domain-containing protein n=1 Tax=Methanogenium organophilum TaxID=2199 RepID=A0A9X9S4D1_METOG|nr:cupin domain-containing protein [Methanogenium organophilum]WAI01563.1 cupin domain-containing protein [Methanogenium organophilum]
MMRINTSKLLPVFGLILGLLLLTTSIAGCTSPVQNETEPIGVDTASVKSDENTVEAKTEPVFEKGMLAEGPLGQMFQGDVWVKMLGSGDGYNSYDVIFSEGARTHWHSHTEIQLLYILSGEGWYQEEGKPAQLLRVGDSVEIPANVTHWHGATADSSFEHLGVTMNPESEQTERFDPVSDEEYANLAANAQENVYPSPEIVMPDPGYVDPETLTFELSDDVTVQKVTYKNRFGIELAGHLYYAKDLDLSEKHPAIVIGPPYGGVKEQGPGIYAQDMARRGFVALAFDPSYNGESGGEPRHTASPEIFVEDFSAGVDFLGTRDFVDREKIGAIGICGSGGFAITATEVDPRIKAVATASMYDISSMTRDGFGYTMTDEQRAATLESVAEGRYETFESGYARQPETPRAPADSVPEGLNPVMSEFFEYYSMERGFHPNALPGFTASSTMGFMNFPMMNYIDTISPRPILFIMGENAHSRYYTEEAYEKAAEPKELVIVPGARHIDLYDGGDNNYIPFDKLEEFFNQYLE